MLRMATVAALDEHKARASDLLRQKLLELPRPQVAQSSGALGDDRLGQLRHAGRRRAGSRRKGKDVQEGHPNLSDMTKSVLKHLTGLCRETRNDIGAEDNIGP